MDEIADGDHVDLSVENFVDQPAEEHLELPGNEHDDDGGERAEQEICPAWHGPSPQRIFVAVSEHR